MKVSPRSSLADVRDRTARQAARLALRMVRHAEYVLTSYSQSAGRTRLDDRPTISFVADPDLAMYLVGVRGALDEDAVESLADACHQVGDGAAIHLDLTGSGFVDTAAIIAIEHLVDGLELRGVHLRIVGIDPLHPVMPPR